MNRWILLFFALALCACNVSDTADRPQIGANNNADAGANSGTEDASTGDTGGTGDSGVVGDPLEVVSVTPMDGATDIALDSQVVLVFSETIDLNTLTEDDVTVTARSTEIPFELDVGADTATLDFTPLTQNSSYEVSIAQTVAGLDSGATLEAPFTFSFQTAGFGVETVMPADGATELPLTTPVVITMTDDILVESVIADSIIVKIDPPLPSGETNVPVTVEINANRIRITPELGYWREFESRFEVSLAPIESVAGVTSDPFSMSFTTPLFAEGTPYFIRCAGRDEAEILLAQDDKDILFEAVSTPVRTEWSFRKNLEEWVISNLSLADLFLEGSDGDTVSLTPPVDENNFFTGQAWSFTPVTDVAVRDLNFPDNSVRAAPFVYVMQTEQTIPLNLALSCASRRPRMDNLRMGDESLQWHFTRSRL